MSKERGCEDLKLWRPAIINHLYWTAASTPNGDPNVMEAKWRSMVNHVQDVHEHGDAAFPHCAHPPLEGEAREQEWLEPGINLKLVSNQKHSMSNVSLLWLTCHHGVRMMWKM